MTCVFVVAELLLEFGSVGVLLTVAVVAMLDPSAALEFALTTRIMVPLDPAGMLVAVQVMVPVPPTAGVLQVTGALSDTKVELAGTGSVKVTLVAMAGPLLEMVAV
jgi:hypothetical protein